MKKTKKTAGVKNKVAAEEEHLTIALLNKELVNPGQDIEMLSKQIPSGYHMPEP